MKIAAWNVNGVRARLDALTAWLDVEQPDVLLLQETKVTDDKWPAAPFQERGYHASLVGSAPLNGVAILSKEEPVDVVRALPGEPEDTQARWIEATIGGFRIASLYLPNGTSVDSPAFAYKLRFFERIARRIDEWREADVPVIVGGDWNVAPGPADVFSPALLDGTICYHPAERAAWRRLTNHGWYDAYRTLEPDGTAFSWWHYQGRAYEKGEGLRIDHFLLSPRAMDRARRCWVDDTPRTHKVASDHAPVLLEIERPGSELQADLAEVAA